jgi:hypothetical protein
MSLEGCEVVGWAMWDLLRREDDASMSETDGVGVRDVRERWWAHGSSAGSRHSVTVLMVPRPPCTSLKACTPVGEPSRLRLPNTGVIPVCIDQPVGDPRASGYIADYSRPHPQHRLLPDSAGLNIPASPVIQPPSPIAPLTLSTCIPFLIPSLTPLVARTAHSTPALIVLRLVPLASSRYIRIRFPVYSNFIPGPDSFRYRSH